MLSGVRILEKSGIEMTFLKGGILNITCEHPTLSDKSKDLIFTVNGKSNISAFSPAFSFENGMSKLFLQKKVVVDDTGSYICGFDSREDSVIVQVFEGKHTSKRNMTSQLLHLYLDMMGHIYFYTFSWCTSDIFFSSR